MPRKIFTQGFYELDYTDEDNPEHRDTLRLVKAFLQIKDPMRRERTIRTVEDIAAGLQDPSTIVH